MDAHPAAGLHEHERAGKWNGPVSARELRCGVSGSGGSRLLLYRTRSSRSSILGKDDVQST